jgi:hypothetical protein
MPVAVAGFGLAPDLAPVIAIEKTDYGWRGVTAEGEVYDVRSESQQVPDAIMVTQAGEIVGRREIHADNVVDIADYLSLFSTAVMLHKINKNAEALSAIDRAISVVDTARARYNRALILLALGHWEAGLSEFENCERSSPFQRPLSKMALALKIKPWRGEDIVNKRLLLVHDHGFGDTLMMLRYVTVLHSMGANVVLCVPHELRRLAHQFAPVVDGIIEADYFVSFLHLLRWLKETPQSVPTGAYVKVERKLIKEWQFHLGHSQRRKVGVAWSVGVHHDGDYPRAMALSELLRYVTPDAEVFSVQKQGREEAEKLNVRCFDFQDFADCAALMLTLDEIISVDTAAVHCAAASGHQKVRLLLTEWHSWRWNGNPFYPHLTIQRI